EGSGLRSPTTAGALEPKERRIQTGSPQSRILNPFRYGGEGGIRTHEAHHLLVFETSSFNRSDTSPRAGANYNTGKKSSEFRAQRSESPLGTLSSELGTPGAR